MGWGGGQQSPSHSCSETTLLLFVMDAVWSEHKWERCFVVRRSTESSSEKCWVMAGAGLLFAWQQAPLVFHQCRRQHKHVFSQTASRKEEEQAPPRKPSTSSFLTFCCSSKKLQRSLLGEMTFFNPRWSCRKPDLWDPRSDLHCAETMTLQRNLHKGLQNCSSQDQQLWFRSVQSGSVLTHLFEWVTAL